MRISWFVLIVIAIGIGAVVINLKNVPITPGEVSLKGKGITAVINDVAIRRSNTGTVTLPKVKGEIVLENDFKKGDKIPIELDLRSLESKTRGGKYKLSAIYLNSAPVIGVNYEFINLWDLSLDAGVNTSGLQGGLTYALTEHSGPELMYSLGTWSAGYFWRF